MSLTTGQQALIDRITTMTTAANVVLPNGPGAYLPRYVIQAAGGAQRTATLGGRTDARPEIVVRVETGKGEFATENDALVATLVARFPVGAKFDGVKIQQAPDPRPPIPSEGAYVIPVIIRGRTSF